MSIELTPDEVDLLIKALGECKLPPADSPVSVTFLIKKLIQEKDKGHPFHDPRLMEWLRKSLE